MKFELQTNVDNDPTRGRLIATYVTVSKLGSVAECMASLDLDLGKPDAAILAVADWVLRIQQTDIPEYRMPQGDVVKIPLPGDLSR